MEKREIDLTVSCYGKVKDVKYDVVILPWGATEPHNLHLPYLTDCILPHDIAVDAAALALERSGVRCMVMPPVPFGAHNPGQRELPFCIHTRYATQQAILEDIVASLHAQGIRKLIIISGHGGNNFKGMIRDLAFVYPDFLILDEPTRGIDIGTKTEIQKLVIQLAQEGKGVLFISSEIEEMLRTCNRLAVLRDGAKVGELSGDMTQEKVMKTIAEG